MHAVVRERLAGIERAAFATRAATRRMSRWHMRAPAIGELLLAPPDLRTADPSFAGELASGQMGLAGQVVAIAAVSPFDARSPSPAFARELHGFGWLRHLDAVRDEAAETAARLLVLDWIEGGRSRDAVAAEPEVGARRLLSWLAHSGLLLDGADPADQRTISRALGDQIARTARAWDETQPGVPRVTVLVALVEAYLAVPNGDAARVRYERELVRALDAYILPDGGTACRNPEAVLELMLDLIPLKQCYLVRGLPPPAELTAALIRTSAMLRYLRLGDGALIRFNGAGPTDRAQLATVLAIDEGRARPLAQARESHYARLEAGPALILLDAGGAPPLAHARSATAGCLAFEMSAGVVPLIVNAGAPAASHADWWPLARATAQHSTLVLGEQSSAELRGEAGSDGVAGAGPLAGPANVVLEMQRDDAGQTLAAAHDGYLRRYSVLHRRTLRLAPDGLQLSGRDTLGPEQGSLRLARDVPFAIHFHVHPGVEVVASDTAGAVDLHLPDGACWRFAADGLAPSIEDSVFLASARGALRCRQIVLRGACYGESAVEWSLTRVNPAAGAAADADDEAMEIAAETVSKTATAVPSPE